jgi:Peptidase A4 family
MRIMLLALVAGASLLAAATASAARAGVHPPRVAGSTNSNSSNWSGYAVTGGPFTSVSASWTQPAVTCGTGETSYSSFWVGLDGDTSNTVEQIGTDSDCFNGVPTYYAWYELYPKISARLVSVSPGDAISASVATDGSGNFTLTISVDGTATTVQGKLPHASLSSAEVIAEAPSSNHGPNGELGLANFDTVSFKGATVDGVSLGQQSPDPITMVQGGTTLAQPSAISKRGDFSIDWKAASGPPSGNGHGHSRP